MNWRRGVRYGAASVGLACAVAVYVLYRPRQVAPPPPVNALPHADPKATESTGPGRMLYDGGRGDLVVEYNARNTFADGRTRFEGAHAVFENGKFDLHADRIETQGSTTPGTMPTTFDIAGHVRFVGRDGLSLETDAAVYDDKTGIVTMPGNVNFTRGRLTGTSVGAEYFRDEERIRLLDQAVAHIAPAADGKGGIAMTSASMVMLRALHSVHLEKTAQITSDRQQLGGDSAVIVFTDDEQAMKFIELRGHASVVPRDAAATDTAEMHGDNITLAFHADGSALQHATQTGQARLMLTDAGGRRAIQGSWIDFYMAPDGRTLTRLDARDRVVVDLPASKTAPARVIRATTLTATGREPKGLERAQFDQNVVFEERDAGRPSTEAPRRTGRAQLLVLQLDGALESVTIAEFRRSVEFVDGTAEARAEHARYDVRTGLLHLTTGDGDPKRLPWVRDEGLELSGRDVQLSTSAADATKAHDVTARGTVTTRLFPKAGDKTRRSALFDAGRDINGIADEVVYTSATRRVVYRGAGAALAQVFQDANRIVAERITLDETTGNLEAEGKVESSLQTKPAATVKDAKAQPKSDATTHRITGDRLQYDDARRQAVYTGAPAMLREGSREIEAHRITLGLGADGNTVETLIAAGEMVARLDKEYELAGDTLEYVAATGKYVVIGAPAIAKVHVEGSKTCTLFKASRLDADISGAVERTGTLRVQDEVSCDTPIRSIRRP